MNITGSIIGIVIVTCGVAFAQKEQTGDVVISKLQAEKLATALVTARFGLIGPTVKDAPYSADGVTETTQTLGDGTHINRQETYSIYRDGEGRVRRESGDHIWISDPVANVSYVLDTKTKTARKLSLSRVVAVNKMQFDDQTAKVKAEVRAGSYVVTTGQASGVMGGVTIAAPGNGPITAAAVKSMGEPKAEPLGKQQMEGVEVEGTRVTTVIPQGAIGNDRPIQITHERWESTQLRETILSKHTDPMAGDTTEKLTNVHCAEPDPALFTVPAGYQVEQEE